MRSEMTRRDVLVKVGAVFSSVFILPPLFSRLIEKDLHAATGPCIKCDWAFHIMGRRDYVYTCFQIAFNKRLKLKDRSDFYKATFSKDEKKCPASRDFRMHGFKPIEGQPFPPNFSNLSPYGIGGHKVTPGIVHPRDSSYSCGRCGYKLFFIRMNGNKAIQLLCGNCSNLMNLGR